MPIERELAMIKVVARATIRVEACVLPKLFARGSSTPRSKASCSSYRRPDKIDQFIDLMRPIGLVEVSRTGVAAMSRGPERM